MLPSRRASSAMSKDNKRRIQQLEKELQRKEKALAEAAALLIPSRRRVDNTVPYLWDGRARRIVSENRSRIGIGQSRAALGRSAES
jgi:hypothetical protein